MTKTVRIRGGFEVLAKGYKGSLFAVTYANLTQANKKAAELNALGESKWEVIQPGRPFCVRRIPFGV